LSQNFIVKSLVVSLNFFIRTSKYSFFFDCQKPKNWVESGNLERRSRILSYDCKDLRCVEVSLNEEDEVYVTDRNIIGKVYNLDEDSVEEFLNSSRADVLSRMNIKDYKGDI